MNILILGAGLMQKLTYLVFYAPIVIAYHKGMISLVCVTACLQYQAMKLVERCFRVYEDFQYKILHFLAEQCEALCHRMNPLLLERIKSRMYWISLEMGISSSTRAKRSLSFPVPWSII